jgi:hypothetical protein
MWKARSSPNARVHRPPPDANIDDGAVREHLKDTVSRADHHGNIRIVVKFPQSREGVPKRIAGLARAYRGPLSIPRRCPLSVVKQRCGSASPGLNRVFRLLPQRLEVLLHQWPRPTDLPRVLDVSGVVDSTPGNGVEPQWNATICTPRGVGRLFDSLKLWA